MINIFHVIGYISIIRINIKGGYYEYIKFRKNDLIYLEVVDEIIRFNKYAQIFWSDLLVWATLEAANLLRQVKIRLANFLEVFPFSILR